MCGEMPADRARKMHIDFSRDAPHVQPYFEAIISAEPAAQVSTHDILSREVELHASSDRDIVLLLVTSSYLEIFLNFVCHTQTLNDIPSRSMFIALSPNVDVVEAARNVGFGAVLLDFQDKWLPQELTHAWSANISDSEFGTIQYQQLIYFRTSTAQRVLELGYNVLIADIDTVWLQNPFLSIYDGANDDVVVTFDDSEVCGCFVYLNATSRTIQFWRDVTTSHLAIIAEYAQEKRERLTDFFESEQKILTRLILNDTYTSSLGLRVSALPESDFPSGVTYFTKSIAVTPVVVHNNYIIGSEMKIMRFRLYGLWRDARVKGRELQCLDPRHQWRVFDAVVYASYPSLTAILPIHDSQLNSSYVKFMLLTDKINSSSTIWVSNDPPSSIDFYPLFVGEFNFTDRGVHTFSSTIHDSNIFVTMDIGLFVSSFSYDRKNMFHNLANDGVPSTWVVSDIQLIRPEDNKTCGIDGRYVFSLNIITFARPWSLKRLLDSLLKADYGGCSLDINIRIDSVTGSKYDNVENQLERESMLALQEETIDIANDFNWPFGNKQCVEKYNYSIL